MNRIRFLRNRIFHHEPIWHWKDLTIQHQHIINLTNGISPAAAKYLKLFDQFPVFYKEGRQQVANKLREGYDIV